MNKEQLLTIIQGGHLTDGDLADAILAELVKVQEPVGFIAHNPGGYYEGSHIPAAPYNFAEFYGEMPTAGTKFYLNPLPRPDLDAEQDKGTTDAQLDSDSNDSRPVELRKLDGPVEMGQLLGNSQNSETGNPKAEGEFPLSDSFRGDNDQLIASIKALLELDADNALVPHGLGGHARVLLTACACRLLQQPDLVAEIERIKTIADNYYAIAYERSQQLSAAQVSESELLNALETLACLGNVSRYGSGQWNAIAQKAITTHKTRKEGNDRTYLWVYLCN